MSMTNNHFMVFLLISLTPIIPLVVSADELNKKEYLGTIRDLSVTVTNTSKNAIPVEIVKDFSRSNTHLNVNVKEIVSLESFCISPDNSLNNLFYYDRQTPAPFVIPEGYSFVVTDVIAFPSCNSDQGNSNDLYLAVVEGPHAVRSFTMKFRGDDSKHYAFNGGITYTAGNEPRPRNTPSSVGRVEIQILGYFVKGDALDPAEPRF